MRSLGLALLALAASASPADAAVISFDDRSSPEDNSPSIVIVVRAAPGETNAMSVRATPGGVLIEDTGAPLTGECQPSGAGRFCPGTYGAVDVFLDDGNDTLRHELSGFIDAGAGDDDVRATNGIFDLVGGPGADRLDATGATSASVDYADHTAGVTVRLNGLADDGAAGEGDNVIGAVTGISGGSANDRLEAGPRSTGLFGGDGDDMLIGGAEGDYLNGGAGDDDLQAGAGKDELVGGPDADVLSGGDGPDEASYGGSAPLRLSIGDGPNDGAAGEGDDIRGDVEALAGGTGDDVLVGDDDANRLIAFGGHDVLRGGGGPDEIYGWGDGDELDGGPGRDEVSTRPRRLGGLDRALLTDSEQDTLACNGAAPLVQADAVDRLDACAPAVVTHARGPIRAHRRLTLFVRCAVETAVPCRGRLWVHLQGPRHHLARGRRLSRVVRFGPIREGRRGRVRILIRRPVPREADYVYVTAVTRRGDGLRTRTVATNVVRYLRR